MTSWRKTFRGFGAWAGGALFGPMLFAWVLLGCAEGDGGPVLRDGCARDQDCPRGQTCGAEGRCRVVPRDDAAPEDARPSTDATEQRDARPVVPLDAGEDAAPDAAPDTGREDARPDATPPPVDMEVPDAEPPPCNPGQREDCGRSVGRCRRGTRVCQEDERWGPCEGGVGPIPEVCNGADDDCNGIIDDGFDIGEPCEGQGECGGGALECRSEFLTRCSTEPGGSMARDRPEVCDRLDNDCDGRVDEGLSVGTACVGACGPGQLECDPRSLGVMCSTEPGGSQGEAEPERCDGRDNDCDGLIDEGFGLGEPCVGVGECGPGVSECGADGAAICSTDPQGTTSEAIDELCNGLDDDCDGLVDEDFEVGEPCEGIGACGDGVSECTPAGDIRCSTDPGGSQSEAGVELCNGRDDDCDGRIDEGFNVGGACPAVGRCPAGALECAPNGAIRCDTGPGGSRSGARAERCNGEDDDCDGQVDNGLGIGDPCVAPGECGAGTRECGADEAVVCSSGPGGSQDRAAPEACDGLDNDCDGIVDEGAACGGDTCETAPGVGFLRTVSGDTRPLSNTFNRSTCLGISPGPDQVFRLNVINPGAYILGVAPLDAAGDPVFWVANQCPTDDSCTVGSGQSSPGRPKVLTANLPVAGNYFVVVDGRDEGVGTPYLLSVRPQAAGTGCNQAIALTVPDRFVGSTAVAQGRGNQVAGTMCPAGAITTGPDQVFRLDLAAPQRVRITVSPTSAIDPVLYVVGACGDPDGTCRGGTNARGLGQPETLTLDLPQGPSFVVVDHVNNVGGAFLIEVVPEP